MTRHVAAVMLVLLGASLELGGCSGSSAGPVQPTVGAAAKLVFTVQLA